MTEYAKKMTITYNKSRVVLDMDAGAKRFKVILLLCNAPADGVSDADMVVQIPYDGKIGIGSGPHDAQMMGFFEV